MHPQTPLTSGMAARIVVTVILLLTTSRADTPKASAQTAVPILLEPADGAQLAGRGTTARFHLSEGAIQYQIQVFPTDGDGPGINLIRNKESLFKIEEPKSGEGNTVSRLLLDHLFVN